MIDEQLNNSKKPKYHIKRYLIKNKDIFRDKIVIDIPAGSGVTTEILHEIGCKAEPFDLFPEYFMLKNIECKRADITERIPVENSHADIIICQEGMEHFSDQLKPLKEFNRILKKGGKLIITTPSYSNLKSKFSYLLFESEYFNKSMPPNEIDSIWMSESSITKEIYHGHIFLTGIQKLRTLAKLSGFRISEINFMRLNKTSLALFPLFYPFIIISSLYTYCRAMRKNKDISKENKKKVYKEQLKLNINPKILLDEHLFIIFEKESEPEQIHFDFNNIFRPFEKIM